MQNILLILNKSILPQLQPLCSVWKKKGYNPLYKFYTKDLFPCFDEIKNIAKEADAVIAFAPSSRSPHTLVEAPFIKRESGKMIPVSIVPHASKKSIEQFVDTACAIHNRKKTNVNVSLLCQRLPRYLGVTQKINTHLKKDKKIKCNNWQGDIIYTEDALFGLNAGGALSMYMGHGRSKGWVGYRGVQLNELKLFANKPNAAILSLCCETASRSNVHLSFSEELIMNGISAFSLGATRKTLFSDNARWAIAISNELLKRHITIGELLTHAIPVNSKAYSKYRLFGDPTVPLYTDKNFNSEISKFKTYE